MTSQFRGREPDRIPGKFIHLSFMPWSLGHGRDPIMKKQNKNSIVSDEWVFDESVLTELKP